MTDRDNTGTAQGLGQVQGTDQEGQSPSFITMRQENGQKILVEFAKTFISVMEDKVFSNTDSEDVKDEEAEEYFDNFGNDRNCSSTVSEAALLVSDEDFAFERYFPCEKRQEFRCLFIDVAFDIFRSYEYQLIMLVREERKISEIAEDIAHRILDNFKESQRGFNPEFIKIEITKQFLIEKALHHSEPEGIIYNSAVEILENPGIIIRIGDQDDHKRSNFYQSHWQKNFLPYRKLIGSKYGFRLRFDFETEETILRNFEKVPNSSVSPLYLNYKYRLDPEVAEMCKVQLLKELEETANVPSTSVGEDEKQAKKTTFKDKVKEFQLKLLIQKQKEDRNSDKVMKQIVNLSQRFENLQHKLVTLEQKGVISGTDEVNKAKTGLLRCNYNVRFEVHDSNSDFSKL